MKKPINLKSTNFAEHAYLKKNKRGQVWIETVIYTLIAFAIIGLVLSFVKPEIQELQDKALIDQSIGVIKDIHSRILEVNDMGDGNKRKIEIGIKKGILKIDAVNDMIYFEIESAYVYSQPGKEVYYGNTKVYTEKIGKLNKVTLTQNYNNTYNITYQGEDKLKSLNKAATPYTLYISNKGGDPTIIDLELG